MATVGYSGTPLKKKLGITSNHRLLLIDPPADYFEWLEEDLSAQIVTTKSIPDFIHLFVKDKKGFETTMKKIDGFFKKNSTIILWVSWYKKSAKMNTDITEDDIRKYAISHGLVDIKVCAVSELWSGLKLVVPKALRK